MNISQVPLRDMIHKWKENSVKQKVRREITRGCFYLALFPFIFFTFSLKKKEPKGKSMQDDVHQDVIIMELYNRSPRLVREDFWERPFYET